MPVRMYTLISRARAYACTGTSAKAHKTYKKDTLRVRKHKCLI